MKRRTSYNLLALLLANNTNRVIWRLPKATSAHREYYNKRRRTSKVRRPMITFPILKGAKKHACTCSNRHPSLSQKRAMLLPRVWKRMFPGCAPTKNILLRKSERIHSTLLSLREDPFAVLRPSRSQRQRRMSYNFLALLLANSTDRVIWKYSYATSAIANVRISGITSETSKTHNFNT